MAKRRTQKRRNEKYQVNDRRLRVKEEYKDTIFRMLYRDKGNLLSLYNGASSDTELFKNLRSTICFLDRRIATCLYRTPMGSCV